VPLYNTPENRELALELKTGLYGSSYRLQVIRDVFVRYPHRSPWKPRGLPERTILEARLADFGPLTSPLYPSTTAEIRPVAHHVTEVT
jgi:hypothetical protein